MNSEKLKKGTANRTVEMEHIGTTIWKHTVQHTIPVSMGHIFNFKNPKFFFRYLFFGILSQLLETRVEDESAERSKEDS